MKTAVLKKVSPPWLAASVASVALIWAAGFTSAPAVAQGTPQQQQACTPDVMRLCHEFVPDVAKITACMSRNRASISAVCKAAFPTASHGRKKKVHRHHA